MFGVILGDITGSVREFFPFKSKEISVPPSDGFLTDDTCLTIATAECLLTGKDYATAYQETFHRHPNVGYGHNFARWGTGEIQGPYNSWGNGSAMRVAPVAYARDSAEEVLAEAKRSAEVTHNHPEGIQGAQATALCVYMARTGASKADIRNEIVRRFNYDLNRTLDEIRPEYSFDVSCQGSVPESILSFLESNSLDDAIRNAVSLGGDADTMACIAGGIAEAFYGPPNATQIGFCSRLLTPLQQDTVRRFADEFGTTPVVSPAIADW